MPNFLSASTGCTAIVLTKFLTPHNTVLDFYQFNIFILAESWKHVYQNNETQFNLMLPLPLSVK